MSRAKCWRCERCKAERTYKILEESFFPQTQCLKPSPKYPKYRHLYLFNLRYTHIKYAVKSRIPPCSFWFAMLTGSRYPWLQQFTKLFFRAGFEHFLTFDAKPRQYEAGPGEASKNINLQHRKNPIDIKKSMGTEGRKEGRKEGRHGWMMEERKEGMEEWRKEGGTAPPRSDSHSIWCRRSRGIHLFFLMQEGKSNRKKEWDKGREKERKRKSKEGRQQGYQIALPHLHHITAPPPTRVRNTTSHHQTE